MESDRLENVDLTTTFDSSAVNFITAENSSLAASEKNVSDKTGLMTENVLLTDNTTYEPISDSIKIKSTSECIKDTFSEQCNYESDDHIDKSYLRDDSITEYECHEPDLSKAEQDVQQDIENQQTNDKEYNKTHKKVSTETDDLPSITPKSSSELPCNSSTNNIFPDSIQDIKVNLKSNKTLDPVNEKKTPAQKETIAFTDVERNSLKESMFRVFRDVAKSVNTEKVNENLNENFKQVYRNVLKNVSSDKFSGQSFMNKLSIDGFGGNVNKTSSNESLNKTALSEPIIFISNSAAPAHKEISNVSVMSNLSSKDLNFCKSNTVSKSLKDCFTIADEMPEDVPSSSVLNGDENSGKFKMDSSKLKDYNQDISHGTDKAIKLNTSSSLINIRDRSEETLPCDESTPSLLNSHLRLSRLSCSESNVNSASDIQSKVHPMHLILQSSSDSSDVTEEQCCSSQGLYTDHGDFTSEDGETIAASNYYLLNSESLRSTSNKLALDHNNWNQQLSLLLGRTSVSSAECSEKFESSDMVLERCELMSLGKENLVEFFLRQWQNMTDTTIHNRRYFYSFCNKQL